VASFLLPALTTPPPPRILVKVVSSISDDDSNQIFRSSVCFSDSNFTNSISTDALRNHHPGVSVCDASATLRRRLFVLFAMGVVVLLFSSSRTFV
jgi:hypothetical protein